jgi:hypothetical protein
VADDACIAGLDEKIEEAKDQSAFLSTISNLQDVLFGEATPGSQTFFGYLTGAPNVSDIYFNRSLPLIPCTSNFEIIGNDPRPIAEDLTRIFFSDHNPNPLEIVATWRRLCQHWWVSPSAAKYQVVAGCQTSGDVVDRKSAKEMMEKEDKGWRECPLYKRALVENLDNIDQPAFPFWLFPLEAFGLMTADGLSPDYEAKPDMKAQPKDLSSYWPKLALSDLD